MKNRKSNKRFWIILLMVVIIPLLLLTIGVNYLLTVIDPAGHPHPIVPNQSSIVEIKNGSYKKYTNYHFKYSFEYPSDYKLVENLQYYKDGIYRQVVLSKDANYDIPNTKFISGSVISFYFDTNRTQELDKIKEDTEKQNPDAEIYNTDFKGLKAIELKNYQKYSLHRVLSIPQPNGVLAIQIGASQTNTDLLVQYEKDFDYILDSFTFQN